MPYKYRVRHCDRCGNEIRGRLPAVKPVTCIDCNLKVAESAARQLAAKNGPYYDRWLESRGPRGRPRT